MRGVEYESFEGSGSLTQGDGFVTAGKKGKQFVARMGRELLADFDVKDDASSYKIKQISQFLIEQYLEGKIDSVSIFHTRFVNTLVQKPEMSPLLPLGKLEKLQAGTGEHSESAIQADRNLQYIYEPSGDEVLSALLPAYIHFQVYQLVLDAKASEHSARMVAMKSATDNAKGMIKDLTWNITKSDRAALRPNCWRLPRHKWPWPDGKRRAVMATKTANNMGSIVQVIGPVVDVEFSGDASMPALLSALEVEYEVGGQKTSVVWKCSSTWETIGREQLPCPRPKGSSGECL